MFSLCRNQRERRYDPCAERTGYGNLQWATGKPTQEAAGRCWAERRRSHSTNGEIRLRNQITSLQTLGGRAFTAGLGCCPGFGEILENQESRRLDTKNLNVQILYIPHLTSLYSFCTLHVSQHSASDHEPGHFRFVATQRKRGASGSFLERQATMPQLLSDFLEEEFLSLNDHEPRKVKQFRNAVNYASMMLQHPAELIDVTQPSFRKQFVEHLRESGFTIHRAESFARCIRQLSDAAQGAKQKTPHETNLIEQAFAYLDDYSGSIQAAMTEILYEGDQLCSGAAEQLEEIQSHNVDCEETEVA